MILSAYRVLTDLGAPLISRYLDKRRKSGKEHPTRFEERLGIASLERPPGTVIWFHGASVGEARSALPLMDLLWERDPHLSILITTGTVTSAEMIAKEQKSRPRLLHQFIPVDRMAYVEKFLTHWQVDLAVWLESDLWPNMVRACAKTHKPMILLNARLSDKSFQNWQRFRGSMQKLLSGFRTIYAQSVQDQARFQALGARTVERLGNLKYGAPDLPYDRAAFEQLQAQVKGRALWMAASTHPGEEAQAMQVHRKLKEQFPDLLSIIVPRHPHRGDQIKAENAAFGLNIVQRSKPEPLTSDSDIYLVDTLGEMGLFYRLCPVVFMGKSLKPLGGQNPLEPARLDSCVICGPFMTNFAEIMDSFMDHEAVVIVRDETEWAEQLARLLEDPTLAQGYARRAKAVVVSQEDILAQTATHIFAHLSQDEAVS